MNALPQFIHFIHVRSKHENALPIDVASYGHIAKLFVDAEPYGDLTRDDLLDNITLSWLANTGVSSARLHREYKGAYINDFNISVPAAVNVFPEEVY